MTRAFHDVKCFLSLLRENKKKNMWVNYLFVQGFNEREILRVRVNGDDRFVGLKAQCDVAIGARIARNP